MKTGLQRLRQGTEITLAFPAIREVVLEDVKNDLYKKVGIKYCTTICATWKTFSKTRKHPKMSGKPRGLGDPDGGDEHVDRPPRAEK